MLNNCESEDWVGFLDADLATPLSEIKALNSYLQENQETEFLLCARVQKLGSNIKRKTYRHYLGRVFATCVSVLFKIFVYDTQCGAKFLKARVAKNAFKESFVSPWFFDVELLLRTQKYLFQGTIPANNKKIVEYPVSEWADIAGSKLSPFDFLKAPFELIKIYKNYQGAYLEQFSQE